MAKEIWKVIKDYPDYMISSFGRVCSHKGRGVRILTLHTDGAGYLKASLFLNGKMYQINVHRLVMEMFIGPCPKGFRAHHKDNNKKNNIVSNLEWMDTSIHNTIHATGAYKLSTNEVEEIRRLSSLGYSDEELGKMFRVARGNIWFIKKGKTWAS